MIKYLETNGWDSSMRRYRSFITVAYPIGLLIVLPFCVVISEDGGPDIRLTSIRFGTVVAMVTLICLGIAVWIKQTESEEGKFFSLPRDEAIRRVESLLMKSGIHYSKSVLDERWFRDGKGRLGIKPGILEFKEVHSIVLELDGGVRRILVADVSSTGHGRTAVSLWPVAGDHIQFFEGLKAAIDAELATGPS